MAAVQPLRVFVGHDPREDIAFQVLRHSILRRASCPVEVWPISRGYLEDGGIWTRKPDPAESTEFSLTRFLAPWIANQTRPDIGRRERVLYMDCDFLVLDDITKVWDSVAGQDFAVACIKHDYQPVASVKMDGRTQTTYPRKCWSAMMLFDCASPEMAALVPARVNEAAPSYLHQMHWAEDSRIAALPGRWHWIEGWNPIPAVGYPSGIHFTMGGPWMSGWEDVSYAHWWREERDHYLNNPAPRVG